MPLLAEVPDWAIFASSTFGAAVVWLASYLATRRKESRQERKEDEKGIVDHQAQLISRLTKQVDELTARLDHQNAKLNTVLAHMGYLEGIMTAKGIEFRKYIEDGTAETAALNSQTKAGAVS